MNFEEGDDSVDKGEEMEKSFLAPNFGKDNQQFTRKKSSLRRKAVNEEEEEEKDGPIHSKDLLKKIIK